MASPLVSGWAARFTMGARFAVISAISAALSYLPLHAAGALEAYWSAITAISVVQTQARATEALARDQFVGAAIGGVVGICAALTLGEGIAVSMAAIVVSILACWSVKADSASRIAGVTTTIILLVPHERSPEWTALVRVSEVGWGVCVATAAVWVSERLFNRAVA